MSEFRYAASPPAFAPDLPRDFQEGAGTVTKEVGCLHVEDDRKYWKCVQRIEMENGDVEIRMGYYSGNGDWLNKPLMLPPDAFADLMDFADGKVF